MIVEYSGLGELHLGDEDTHQWHVVDIKEDPGSNLWHVRGRMRTVVQVVLA